MSVNPVDLSAHLVQCKSVTPADDGAIQMLSTLLTEAGFRCTRIPRGGINNLYARFGTSEPVFGFNGHTDVVPVGDESSWTHPPFGGEIHDGVLWGRGAQDMKSGVAAFVVAAIKVTRLGIPGSIAIMITGDEEGPAKDGTVAILDWMKKHGEKLDLCIVGEPTSKSKFGDMIKIGRRGSMNVTLTVEGKQGHVAYPHKALNPATALTTLLYNLMGHELDKGTDTFDPSTFAITTIDVGNQTTNIIPALASARFNIRFNDAHTSVTLSKWIRNEAMTIAENTGVTIEVDISVSGESFVTPPGAFSTLIANAITVETGQKPELSTSGGTSDARFITNICPVVEVGLTGDTMHQVNECVPVDEINRLTAVYTTILMEYFRET